MALSGSGIFFYGLKSHPLPRLFEWQKVSRGGRVGLVGDTGRPAVGMAAQPSQPRAL